MKNIKFRAYSKKEEQMYHSDDGRGFEFVLSPQLGNGIKDMRGNDLDLDFSEWMQYMGYQDENGKDIYEGDIIETEHGAKGVLMWSENEYMQFCFNCEEPMWGHPIHGMSGKKKVIGNIHQNRELMIRKVL